MSAAPSPSGGRGEIVLQPAYFTSSVFVHAARADVDCLIEEYSQQYARSACSRNQPFALFREIWQRQGWTWVQFKVFDARSRATFLRVVLRLFVERIGGGEMPLGRAAALFGLYTVFRTQPSTPARPLYAVAHAEVTCDAYEEMLALPDVLDGQFLAAIRPHVVYVQSELLEAHAFQILPHAAVCPLNPRVLPREVVVGGCGAKRRGRPSKRERTRAGRESLVALERRCGDGGAVPSGARDRYATARSALLQTAGADGRWERARLAVAERLMLMM